MHRRLSVAFLFLAGMAQAQHLAVVRATGQFDGDGTILYSVYVASRTEALAEVTISSALPAGTRYLENVDRPRDARYEGVADNVVVWTLPELAADSVVGPFTYRLKIDGTVPEVPAFPAAAVAYQRPLLEFVDAPAASTSLRVFAEAGSLSFDSRGTVDASGANAAIEIGETGVLLFVPAGAVNVRTTLTIRRLPLDDRRLPANAAGTWWCGLYQFDVEPANATLAENVVLGLTTRRALTPGLATSVFESPDLVNWQVTKGSDSRAIGFGAGGGGSVQCFQQFGMTFCSVSRGFGFGGGFGAFGVSDAQRQLGNVSGSSMSSVLGASVTAAQITDGTSNTIIAILIGRR